MKDLLVEVPGVHWLRRQTPFNCNILRIISSITALFQLSTDYTTLYKILQLFHLRWAPFGHQKQQILHYVQLCWGSPIGRSLNFSPTLDCRSCQLKESNIQIHLIAKYPSKQTYFWIVIISIKPARLRKSKFPWVENGSRTPLRLLDFATISSEL